MKTHRKGFLSYSCQYWHVKALGMSSLSTRLQHLQWGLRWIIFWEEKFKVSIGRISHYVSWCVVLMLIPKIQNMYVHMHSCTCTYLYKSFQVSVIFLNSNITCITCRLFPKNTKGDGFTLERMCYKSHPSFVMCTLNRIHYSWQKN